jgi:hypothetical protein
MDQLSPSPFRGWLPTSQLPGSRPFLNCLDLGCLDLGCLDLGCLYLGNRNLAMTNLFGEKETRPLNPDARRTMTCLSLYPWHTYSTYSLGCLDLGSLDLGCLDLGCLDLGCLDIGCLDLGSPDLGDLGIPVKGALIYATRLLPKASGRIRKNCTQ